MQLTVCTGRRCWRNGAGLLLAAAQLSAPPELAVISTACSGFCPPGKVLVCEEASCPGPTMILAIESEEAATKAAAEAIATTLAHGRSDHFSSHECCGHSCGDLVATNATAPVIAERRTVPPQMKLPPSSFEERMNQQRAARRERDAAPAERPEAAEEATAVAGAAGAAGAAEAAVTAEADSIARDNLTKEADRVLGAGWEGAGEPRASLAPAEVVPLLMPKPKPKPKLNPNPNLAPHPNPNANLSPNPNPNPNPNPKPNPKPKPNPNQVVPLLMRALQFNAYPHADSGLHAVWAFATGTTCFLFGNNRTEFVESAHETAGSMPISFYKQLLVHE